jgi:hypothetical protein
MGAGTAPRALHQAAAITIFILLIASAFFFWLGIPILVLWGLSKVIQSRVHHYVLGLIAAPVAMAVFAPFLFWLNRVYMRVMGRLPDDEPAISWRRGLVGPLEYVLVASLLVSVVALVIWFFFIAKNPPRQFI